MCKCTPEIKTPFYGKPGCEWPVQQVLPVPLPDDMGGQISTDQLERIGRQLRHGASGDCLGITLSASDCRALLEWIGRTDAYITVMRQRIYGRADGKYVGDWDCERAGQHCIPGMLAVKGELKDD